jgi:hypothetical protein
MDSITTDFGEVLLWSFWFFIWVAAFMVWFRCIFDMFGDRELSGWAKAGWVILLIFVPWLGALIYLIARGRSMNQRSMTRHHAPQEEYLPMGTPSPTGAVQQIASAKQLLDSGAIDQAEYDALKAKALA